MGGASDGAGARLTTGCCLGRSSGGAVGGAGAQSLLSGVYAGVFFSSPFARVPFEASPILTHPGERKGGFRNTVLASVLAEQTLDLETKLRLAICAERKLSASRWRGPTGASVSQGVGQSGRRGVGESSQVDAGSRRGEVWK